MIISQTELPEVFIIKNNLSSDNRGWFMESFRMDLIKESLGREIIFCQDNLVKSYFGVLRGLHFQQPPYAQSKLISVVQGVILDVVVDIRKGSPNFGKHISVELSNENNKQVFIPRGFAHGYICLSKLSLVNYKVDNNYNKTAEAGIAFNDPNLDIDWQLPIDKIILSQKDKSLPFIDMAKCFDYSQLLYE
tara:strand:- start:388 stop:960 length:573 start_codon:yes stop_codon:yes gene_type:complete